mgnify:CR=1 FL=1
MTEKPSSFGSVKCPVCATPIIDKPVKCDRCETPHHTDCWTYAEGCAIFGCRNNFISKYTENDWCELKNSTQILFGCYSFSIWNSLFAALLTLAFFLVSMATLVFYPSSLPKLFYFSLFLIPATLFYYSVSYLIYIVRIGSTNRSISKLLGKNLSPPDKANIELTNRVELPIRLRFLSHYIDSYNHLIDAAFTISCRLLLVLNLMIIFIKPIRGYPKIMMLLVFLLFFAFLFFGALETTKRGLNRYSILQNQFIASFKRK